jgi:hypothetical protein
MVNKKNERLDKGIEDLCLSSSLFISRRQIQRQSIPCEINDIKINCESIFFSFFLYFVSFFLGSRGKVPEMWSIASDSGMFLPPFPITTPNSTVKLKINFCVKIYK